MNKLSGLFSMLSTRHVLRTLAWYLAASYALVQVGVFLSQMLGTSDAWTRNVFVLLLAALPLVAALAWRYDIGDHGVVKVEGSFLSAFIALSGIERIAFAGVSSLALLFTFALAIVLWPDDDLTPESERVLGMPMSVDAAPKRLVYGVYGLFAPDDDPWRLGKYRLEAFHITGELPADVLPLPFTMGRKAVPCFPDEPGCFASLLVLATDPNGPLTKGQKLLTRIRLLQSSTPIEMDMSEHDLPWDSPAQTAFVAGLEVAVLETLRHHALGDDATTWAVWTRDLDFYRRGIRESRTRAGKLRMAFWYARQIKLGAQICADAVRRGRRCGMPEISPISDLEYGAATAIATSVRASLAWIMRDGGRWSIEYRAPRSLWNSFVARALPLKPNMTTNTATELAVAVARASALPPAEWLVAERDLVFRPPTFTERLFNPAGVLYLEHGPDLRRAVWVKHDLNSLTVLVMAVRAAALDGVDLTADPSAFRARYGWAIDPISGLPPRVDGSRVVFDRHEGYEADFKLAIALR